MCFFINILKCKWMWLLANVSSYCNCLIVFQLQSPWSAAVSHVWWIAFKADVGSRKCRTIRGGWLVCRCPYCRFFNANCTVIFTAISDWHIAGCCFFKSWICHVPDRAYHERAFISIWTWKFDCIFFSRCQLRIVYSPSHKFRPSSLFLAEFFKSDIGCYFSYFQCSCAF
jgi:hypothetical protein